MGHAEGHREIRSRYPEAVVVARIDDHVRCRGHVAADTVGAPRILGVEVMVQRLIPAGRVATEADPAARGAELAAVWVMAVRARHTAGEHLGLEEGAVFVDLVADLSIGVVQAVVQQRDPVGVA
jgi:hypothetical protein